MQAISPRIAAAGTGAIALVVLAGLQSSAAIRARAWADPEVHMVLIALGNALMFSMAVAMLFLFFKNGKLEALGLSAALLAFVAFYIWHGIFTGDGHPFGFLIYGPASRVAFALLLPIFLLKQEIAPKHRTPIIVALSALALIVSILAGLQHDAITVWASLTPLATLQKLRLAIELSAGLLVVVTIVVGLSVKTHHDSMHNDAIWIGTTMLAVQSLYFMISGAWTAGWWAAHALGAGGSLTIGLTVIASMRQDSLHREMGVLRENNELKTNFINAAAHEIGTPITPVRLQLSILERNQENLTEKQRNSLRIIGRNIERLVELTSRIVEGARSQRGHIELDVKHFDLRTTIDELIPGYVEWCVNKGISLKVDAPKGVKISSDERRIQQVVANFISNAIKYTPPGGVITLAVKKQAKTFTISVTDTGAGLTQNQQKQLFQPFAQVGGPNSPAGSGLGLYISRQIAKALGGTVGVSSAGPGRGSTFYVELSARLRHVSDPRDPH